VRRKGILDKGKTLSRTPHTPVFEVHAPILGVREPIYAKEPKQRYKVSGSFERYTSQHLVLGDRNPGQV